MSARPGVVYLVGAGPGDPGLVTARALELLATADVVAHDRLIPPGILAHARDDAETATAAGRITDRAALVELTAERAAAAALGGSCETPIGVCARFEEDQLVVRGYAGLPDGSEWVRDRVAGDPDQPAALGETLAERMLATGAREILERAAA